MYINNLANPDAVLPPTKSTVYDEKGNAKQSEKQCKEHKGRVGFYLVMALIGIVGLSFLFKPKENGLKLMKWGIVFLVSSTIVYNLFFTGDSSWSKELTKDCSKDN